MTAVRLLRATGDEALARRASRGDQEAFGVLFSRYQLRLELYCRSILRHEEDARDAAQNAMTKAFVALQGREQDLAVRAWLFRIAHNESISLMRRRRPTDELRDETVEAAGVGAAASAAPAETLELREELSQVLGGIRELPPRARQALLLRELADLDYAAVGQVLGISSGGARQAVFEARTALQADRAGRDAPCESIRRELSEADHRRRPTRQVRGHLRGCDGCRSWSHAQDSRRERLAVLPGAGLAGGSLWGWLTGLFGVGGAGAGGAVTMSAGSGFGVGAKALAGVAALAAGATPVAVHEVERTLRHEKPAAHAESTTPAQVAVAVAPTRAAVPAPAAATPTDVAATRRAVATSTASADAASREAAADDRRAARRERAEAQDVDDTVAEQPDLAPRAHQAALGQDTRRAAASGRGGRGAGMPASGQDSGTATTQSRPGGNPSGTGQRPVRQDAAGPSGRPGRGQAAPDVAGGAESATATIPEAGAGSGTGTGSPAAGDADPAPATADPATAGPAGPSQGGGLRGPR